MARFQPNQPKSATNPYGTTTGQSTSNSDSQRYVSAGTTLGGSTINPVTGTLWGTGTATPTTQTVTQSVQTATQPTMPYGSGVLAPDYVMTNTGNIVKIDNGTPPATAPATNKIDLQEPVERTVITGLTQAINANPFIPITINPQGRTEFTPFKAVTMPVQAVSDVLSGGNENFVTRGQQAGTAIYEAMTPETRTLTTGLALAGTGLVVAPLAPVISASVGLGSTTSTAIATGALVSTAIGVVEVAPQAVKQTYLVANALPDEYKKPLIGIQEFETGIIKTALSPIPIMNQVNFTELGVKLSTDKTIDIPYAEQVGVGKAGSQYVEQTLSQRGTQTPFGTTDQILANLLPASNVLFGDNPQSFKQGAYEYFKGLGNPDDIALAKAEQVYKFEGQGRAIGEIASLFPAGAIGEIGVRTAVKSALASETNFFKTKILASEFVGKKAFWGALAPSAIEGATLYSTQQIARREDITPEGLILSGVLSGATGAVGARFIAKQSILRPALGNAVYKASWLVQADEPAGDFTADVLTGASQNMVYFGSGKQVVKLRAPTAGTSSLTSSQAKTSFNTTGATSIYDLPSDAYSGSLTANQSLSNTNNSIYSITNNQTPSDSSSGQFTITPAPTNTVTNSFTNNFTSTSSTATETITNTFTGTQTATATGNLPFLPLMGTGGSGENPIGSGAQGRARSKFYNELKSAIGSLQAFNLPAQTFKQYKKGRGKKAKVSRGVPQFKDFTKQRFFYG